MTVQEFSEQFDVLFNNAANTAPGLDEYEKSVYLNKAQEDVLKNYFSPLKNKSKAGFDGNELRGNEFDSLSDIYINVNFTQSFVDLRKGNVDCVISNSIYDNIFFCKEELIYSGNKSISSFDDLKTDNDFYDLEVLQVVPLSYKEYRRLMMKPYKRPLKNQVWKLVTKNSNDYTVTLIPESSKKIIGYVIKFIKRPRKIDLEKGINCELSESLHQEVLQRAVEMAKASWELNLKSQVVLGNTSQTDIGLQ